jgi:hypothetical protein
LNSKRLESNREGRCRYEAELPIQCVPEIVKLLVAENIAVYQVVRYAKTTATWINDQWRVCFIWDESGPECIEIVDYH